MPSSQIVDLAIGLIFVFGITAALVSVITELVARLIGLRGAYLLSGLRQLVDGGDTVTSLADVANDFHKTRQLVHGVPGPGGYSPEPTSATGALLGSPILSSHGIVGLFSGRQLTLAPSRLPGRLPMMSPRGTVVSVWQQRRSLPSYISASSFAEAAIVLVAPDRGGPTTMTEIQRGIQALPHSMGQFRASLQALAVKAGDDVGLFSADIERWYEDHMDRVSGWYKRHVGRITLAVAIILILLLNINLLTTGRTLYTGGGVNSAVSTAAAKSGDCAGLDERRCLANLQAELTSLPGLPIGWGTVTACRAPGTHCGWLGAHGITNPDGGSPAQVLVVILGFLITAIALVAGARFWFDLLGGLGSLRLTGPKPAPPAG